MIIIGCILIFIGIGVLCMEGKKKRRKYWSLAKNRRKFARHSERRDMKHISMSGISMLQ